MDFECGYCGARFPDGGRGLARSGMEVSGGIYLWQLNMKGPVVVETLPGPHTKGWFPVVQDDFTTLRAFLVHFPQEQKSHVANIFLAAVRQGAQTAGGVLTRVTIDLHERLRRAAHYRDKTEHTKIDNILYYFEHYDEDAEAFARWALAWEKLSPAEKARHKAGTAREAIRAHMDREDPTAKQSAYLRKMGYTGPIDSKAHASALIDIYLRGGRVEAGGVA